MRDLDREGQGVSILPAGVLTLARRAAESTDPVLLRGETGSGKTHLAKLIHSWSRRSRQPYVRVNCGAIPESLFEREMFGHERGAFTGADSSREGLFEAAKGGTILLDEIAELGLLAQVKLLDVLDSHLVRRLGASRSIGVDVRIMSATNAQLEALVAQGRFRSDLYYRLAVLQIELPPLRGCRNFEMVVNRVLAHVDETATLEISAEARALLMAHSWPGNIRELRNALCVAKQACRDRVIRPDDLRDCLRHLTPAAPPKQSIRRQRVRLEPGQERDLIKRVLLECEGNRRLAARRLHMSRSTLWLKMKLHSIDIAECVNAV